MPRIPDVISHNLKILNEDKSQALFYIISLPELAWKKCKRTGLWFILVDNFCVPPFFSQNFLFKNDVQKPYSKIKSKPYSKIKSTYGIRYQKNTCSSSMTFPVLHLRQDCYKLQNQKPWIFWITTVMQLWTWDIHRIKIRPPSFKVNFLLSGNVWWTLCHLKSLIKIRIDTYEKSSTRQPDNYFEYPEEESSTQYLTGNSTDFQVNTI